MASATSGATADVRLLADGTTLADVLPELLRLTGAGAPTVMREGVDLDVRTPVAHLHDGDLLVLGAGETAATGAAARIAVAGGPDAGRTIALAAGRLILGRDAEPLRSTDPLVSRCHVEVVVTHDGDVTVTDLRTRNGSHLGDDALMPGMVTPWPPGGLLRIGDSVLTHGRSATAAIITLTAHGVGIVNRAPRINVTSRQERVTFPRPPTPGQTPRVPLLASVAPLAAGAVLAVIIRRWEFVAFALMSPLVVVSQWASDRWRGRQAGRRAAADHAAATTAAERSLAAAVTAEVEHRHAASPDLGSVVSAALERTSLLWQRGLEEDDALTVRLGAGTLPASIEIDGDRTPPALQDVPVCLDLLRFPVVGICGPDHLTAGLARSIVVQAGALVGPRLQIRVLAPGQGSHWAWSRWLPHLRPSPDELGAPATTGAVLQAAVDEIRSLPERGRCLVIVHGVTDVAVATTLSELPGVSVLWLATEEPALPATCTAVVATSGVPARASVRGADYTVDDVVPDLLAVDVAESVARALCSLRESTGLSNAIPTEVPWSGLHGLRLDDDADTLATSLARRWRNGPTVSVCLGVTATAPLVVDLHADGPHMLVAGTTGAGKSELLQTLVASLVVSNSPNDLNLLLVDYKGGAAFGSCGSLPHTVGVLTDLDAAATTRAIDSLSAELRRRERVLAAAHVPDLETWRSRAVNADEHLPRLVIIVDEFATLAEELPDFVGGLVGIAQRGRSLGVHLVLATQRPEGAVSADIRANVRMRVCLAVAREAESRDVLDSPAALGISRTTPGRALLRLGNADLVEMQTARVTGPAASNCHGLVQVVAAQHSGERSSAPAATGTTELDVLVAAAAHAAHMLDARIPTPPWLPPLPNDVALSDVLVADDPAQVAIGLLDLPEAQRQPPLRIDAQAAEPLLIVGGPRSGRTTAAMSLATALATVMPPDQLHLWAVDSGKGLRTLADLPHSGAVIDVRDGERLDRLLTFLADEIERRRSARHTEPALLLLVDSWDGLARATADPDTGRCQDLLLQLAAEGASAGLRVVMTSDRSGLAGRVSSVFNERICLRLADPTDYALLGLAPRQVPTDLPPGRGLHSSGGQVRLMQLARPDDRALSVAKAWATATRLRPRRFDPLPLRVPLHALPRHGGTDFVVGVCGDDLGPARVEPADTGGAFLIAGPPRSGRSTALVTIASQLRSREVLAICARPGPLHRRRDLALVLDAANADELRAAIASSADAAVLVDDVDLLDDPAILDVIEGAVRSARDGRGFVVLAGATDAMTTAFRGPVAQARRGRAGLLLRPEGPHDGELFGLRLRRRHAHADPPGRGLLAMHGSALPVQLADPG